MKFEDLNFEPLYDGVQAKPFFPNGYGASIVKHYGSYGSSQGLYELAVLKGNASEWDLTCDTPITDDVLGHLSTEEVSTYLNLIEDLPKCT